MKKSRLEYFETVLNVMDQKNIETSVTILGSGTCVPSLRRSSCSVLMEIKSKVLIFDLGPGTMRRLVESGRSIFDVSYIFFSHFHPDHTGELVSFLFANKYPDGLKRQTPLVIAGGKGFLDFFNGLKAVYGHWMELEPNLSDIVEFDNKFYDIRRFDEFTVETLPVEHNKESIAYRVTDSSGISVVYSGDTDFSSNLIDLAKDADLFICESAFPDNLKVNGHLTPSIAGEIAARANVKKLVLTHFYPECDKEDIEKQLRKTYAGPFVLAEDLVKIDFGAAKTSLT